MSMAGLAMAGSVVSSMVKVAVVEVVFPQSSEAVKMTVAEPVAPQRSLSSVKSLDQVTPLQMSLAAPALPLAASQAFSWVMLPAPSHSTVMSMASLAMVGAVVSSMVNVADVCDSLPHSSVAVKVTVRLPVSPQSSLSASKSLLQVKSPQASSAVAPPWLSNQA